MPLGMPYGVSTFGQLGHLGNLVDPAILSKPRRYRVEVRSGSGALLAEVPRMLKAEMTERVNEPSSIELAVSDDEFCAAYLTRPNRIRVYDVADRPLEDFVIWGEGKTNEGGTRTVRVRGLSLVSLLSYDRLDEDYHVEASDGKTVWTVVWDLLQLQENTPKITIGRIDPAYGSETATLHVDKGESIWTGLTRLVDAHGGYMWVGSNHGLYWKVRRGLNLGQEFRHGKNLRRVNTDLDHTQIVTKLYAYGKAEGDTYLSLKDAGESEEYLLAPLAYRNTYGIMKRFVHNPDISEPERLLKWATRYLAENREPDFSYEADILDMSHSAELGYDPLLGIQLGNTVTVFDDIIPNGQVAREFVEVRRDLRQPQQTSAVLGRLPKNIVDTIVEIDKFTKRKPNAPVWLHRSPNEDGVIDLTGARHGDLIFLQDTEAWKGLKLSPITGRLPDAGYTLQSLGGTPVHILPTSGNLAGISWSVGDLYYWKNSDNDESWGGIGVGGVKHPFLSVGNDGDTVNAYIQTIINNALLGNYRRMFSSIAAVPEGGWLASDMYRDETGLEYIRNKANDGWVLWSDIGPDPWISDGA